MYTVEAESFDTKLFTDKVDILGSGVDYKNRVLKKFACQEIVEIFTGVKICGVTTNDMLYRGDSLYNIPGLISYIQVAGHWLLEDNAYVKNNSYVRTMLLGKF